MKNATVQTLEALEGLGFGRDALRNFVYSLGVKSAGKDTPDVHKIIRDLERMGIIKSITRNEFLVIKKSCRKPRSLLTSFATKDSKRMNYHYLLNSKLEDAILPPEQLPINLCVTSPPYNLDIAYDTHEDNKTYAAYLHWCEGWMRTLYGWMADDGRVCINVPFKITPPQDKTNNYPIAADYIGLMQKVGFHFSNQIVWDKGNKPGDTCWGSFDSASSPFVRDPAECILIFYKKQWAKIEKDPGKKKSTFIKNEFVKLTQNVWQFGAEKKKNVGGHPAAFPLELPTRCIRLFSYKNDRVLDPFMGSGTTGEAAMVEGRNFVGIEMSKQYFGFAEGRIDGAKVQHNARRMVVDPEPEPEVTPKAEEASV